MAVIRCGESPKDCGTFSAATTEYPLYLEIPIGVNASGNCYVSYTTYSTHELTKKIKVNIGGLFSFAIPYKVKVVKPETQSAAYEWSLAPFKIGVRSTLSMKYNSEGHLIATLKDITSTVLGTAGDVGYSFYAPLCMGGDFGFAMDVSTSAAVSTSDGGWKKCFGGWWSGARYCDGNSCYAGCTSYIFNKWTGVGAKYQHNGNNTVRKDGSVSWDLGKVRPGTSPLVFVHARSILGNCSNARFEQNGVQMSGTYSLPPLSICPPTVNHIEMERDICKEKVFASMSVHIPQMGVSGMTLHVQYVSAGSESEALASGAWLDKIVPDVKENSDVSITIDDALIPDTNYFFKLSLSNGDISSDELMVCGNRTPYIPNRACVVPLLSEAECAALVAGDCLAELTEDNMERCC